MSNELEKIDVLIKDALTKEETKFYNELDEQNLFQMLGGLFYGKMKWLMVLINFVIMAFFGLFIYCAIQFFSTNVTNELIKWGLFGTFSMMIVGSLKMFLWNQMDKNSIKRELKRIELQISILNSRLDK